MTTVSKKMCKTIRKVSHPRRSHPRDGDVERIPEGVYLIYLIDMTKQLGSESNC